MFRLELLKNNRRGDKEFSLGLGYSEVMNLSAQQLSAFLNHTSREEVIDWLQWNDPNGIYSDAASLSELGTILSKEEGIGIMKRQIFDE